MGSSESKQILSFFNGHVVEVIPKSQPRARITCLMPTFEFFAVKLATVPSSAVSPTASGTFDERTEEAEEVNSCNKTVFVQNSPNQLFQFLSTNSKEKDNEKISLLPLSLKASVIQNQTQLPKDFFLGNIKLELVEKTENYFKLIDCKKQPQKAKATDNNNNDTSEDEDDHQGNSSRFATIDSSTGKLVWRSKSK
jgi:hypothetical protein